MNPARCALVVLSILVAVFAAAAPAGAKTRQPNLVVTKVSKPPKQKTVGSKLKLVVKVANRGGATASASKLGLYLGKGKKHTKKDKRLKRVKVKALAVGKSKKLKLKVLLPKKTKPGTYRLFACADDTRKVKEAKERDNCRGSKKLRLVANTKAVATIPPLPPAAPAFSMTDDVEWGFNDQLGFNDVKAGTPVTATLRVGNGIAGQAGYARSNVSPEPFASGTATTLDYSASDNSEDDGTVVVQLPFAFPFGGIAENKVTVSNNGWVGFGSSPAYDYWEDAQTTDYRGVPEVVGELERGIMPYLADLNLEDTKGAGTGTVKEVVAADNSFVAFQWDTGQYNVGVPRRTFQLVLFPNGNFRLDYPGANEEGGNNAFVGYSLGSGPTSLDAVATSVNAVPSSSILFAPNPVSTAGPLDAGKASLTLPQGSSFVSADAGCGLAQAPTATEDGLVTCSTPVISGGQQAAWNVTFAAPPNAPGETSPANFRYRGTLEAGGFNLTDRDEIDLLTTDLRPAEIKLKTEFTGGSLEAGVPTTFNVKVNSSTEGLDEPTVTFDLTRATFSSAKIAGQAIECSPPGGSSATCVLPSGMSATEVELTVVSSSDTSIELKATAQALNAPPASGGVGVVEI
jgi:hypothetical protein